MGNKSIQSIHLVDPSKDVINVLQKKVVDSYITDKPFIHIHQMKGQSVILDSLSKTIFIAGMGGREIGEIIQHLLPQLSTNDRVVISPHRNILELRKYLNSTDLRLIDEVLIKEDGQFYQILCLSMVPECLKVPLFGEKIWQGQLGREYRDYQIRFFSFHQDEQSQTYLSYLKCL